MLIEINSLKELDQLAAKVAKNLKGNEVFALTGNLGAGKTTFTKKLLKHSGVKKNTTSPTFVLMLPYRSGGRIPKHTFYHMDLYRINSYKEVRALGVEDLWARPGNIFLIEWADKITKHLPKDTIFINFKPVGVSNSQRIIEFKNAPKELQKNISI